MSNTWRYVSEANGHRFELYEQLMETAPATAGWEDETAAKLVTILNILNAYNVQATINDWADHAIAYLGQTPSARRKKKFKSKEDEILFLCVTLWFAREAYNWLNIRNDEGLLNGGPTYRKMTERAAIAAYRRAHTTRDAHKILPYDNSIMENLAESCSQAIYPHYMKWSYDEDLL